MAMRSRDVNENPCNMCMPMGGILAFKGVEQAMVIVHGSQGCSTYMRRHIAEHFNEPVDVGSSSLNEKGTVYGGEGQLKQALDNIRAVYRPQLIGVVTTCLAETIGEDVKRIAGEYLQQHGGSELAVVAAATPGYGDSYGEGYHLAVKALVETLATDDTKHDGINIISTMLSPADIRWIKELLSEMGIAYTFLPDISDTLDRPYAESYSKLSGGGTPLAAIRAMAGARATLQLGWTMRDELSAGKLLEARYGVPCHMLPLPIGLENTDRFLAALTQVSGKKLPPRLEAQRGRLLDAMVDSHKYNFAGRSVLFGEPDWVYAVTTLCLENGLLPVVAATGSRASRLVPLLEEKKEHFREEPLLLAGADFVSIREAAVARGANLAVGPSDGRYLEERCGMPLVRLGFPIHDRVGGQRLLSVGYEGSAMLLDRLTNALLEHKYKGYRRSMEQAFLRTDEEEESAPKPA